MNLKHGLGFPSSERSGSTLASLLCGFKAEMPVVLLSLDLIKPIIKANDSHILRFFYASESLDDVRSPETAYTRTETNT